MCSVASCISSTSGFWCSTRFATSSAAAPVRRNRFQLMTFTHASRLWLPIAPRRLAGVADLLGEQARGSGGGLQFASDRLAALVNRGDHLPHGDAEADQRRFGQLQAPPRRPPSRLCE